MGWVRPDLGIQIATFLLLFSPVTFVLQFGVAHGADCDVQQIWAPLDQSSLPELGRQEQCCWVNKQKPAVRQQIKGWRKAEKVLAGLLQFLS